MGARNVEEREQKSKRYAELVDRVKQYREKKIGRVRLRGKLGFQLSVVAAALAFAAMLTLSRTELHFRLESFNNLCAGMKDGTPLEAARGLASERRLEFEPDEQTSRASGELVYHLRPEKSWPEQYSCRFRVSGARLYRF